MLLIACPHCGPRPEIEFRCGGEAHIARPAVPADVGDADWGQYLFYRTNPKGVHAERWLHAHGCQRWFNALRDTASDRIIATYAMGAPRPAGGGTTSAGGSPPTPNPSPRRVEDAPSARWGGEEC
jgi:sarcosine oxidase subunit delta